MQHAARRITRYLTEMSGGFLAGAVFAGTLVLGVALFVGRVVLRPPLRGGAMEDILDHVVGPGAFIFAVVGLSLGAVRAARWDHLAPARFAGDAKDGVGGAVLTGVGIVILVTLVAGLFAWPWVLIAWSERAVDLGVLLGTLSGPAAVGLVALLAWQVLRRRRAAAGTSGPSGGLGRAAARTSPPLVAVAAGSSGLLAVGTLGAVADWHPFFVLLGGVPLVLAVFFGHLLGCLWFFRSQPPSRRRGARG